MTNISAEVVNENSTYFFKDDTKFVQMWIIVIFFILIIIGMCLNLIVFLVLLQSKRNGVLSTVLQLSMVDVISTYVAIMEVWALNHHSWSFPSEMCPVFLGSEILFNTLILYLTICVNFHVISKSNLHEFELQKTNKNPLTAVDNDDEDSHSSLIGRLNTNHRNVTINYQTKRHSISVIFPSVLLWFISFSISIPEFSLSSAIKINDHFTMCTVVDIYFNKLLQYVLIGFRIIIPLPLLLLLLLILSIKYCRCQQPVDDSGNNILDKKTETIKAVLLFSLVLTVVCILTSLPRQYIFVMHLLNQKFQNDNIVGFKMPPLENVFVSYYVVTIVAIFYYSAGIIRGIMYILMLPELKNSLRYKITFCSNRNKS